MAEHTIQELAGKLEALDRLYAERSAFNAEALRLRTAEIERRLEHLNGEQARTAGERLSFVTREMFDLHVKEDEKSHGEFTKFMSANQGGHRATDAAHTMLRWLVGIGLIAIFGGISSVATLLYILPK